MVLPPLIFSNSTHVNEQKNCATLFTLKSDHICHHHFYPPALNPVAEQSSLFPSKSPCVLGFGHVNTDLKPPGRIGAASPLDAMDPWAQHHKGWPRTQIASTLESQGFPTICSFFAFLQNLSLLFSFWIGNVCYLKISSYMSYILMWKFKQ